MTQKLIFTAEERTEAIGLYKELMSRVGETLLPDDEQKIRSLLSEQLEQQQLSRNDFGLNPILLALQTAKILVDETGLKRDSVLSVLLHSCVVSGFVSIDDVRRDFGESVARILHGLCRIQELYKKNIVILVIIC